MARNSSVRREEADARIDADCGDEDDEVYIRWGTSNGKRDGAHTRMGEVYHEDPDCFYLNGAETENMTRHAAQIRWKYPCLNCTIPTYNREDVKSQSAD